MSYQKYYSIFKIQGAPAVIKGENAITELSKEFNMHPNLINRKKNRQIMPLLIIRSIIAKLNLSKFNKEHNGSSKNSIFSLKLINRPS